MNQLAAQRELLAAAAPGPDLCVEFFGLPGSGKSTIAREVHAILARREPAMVFAPALLRDEAFVALRVAAKLRLVLSEASRGGTGIWTWTEAVRRTMAIRQPRFRDRLRASFTMATVGALYAAIRRRRLGAVLDQGMLQALWSVRLRLTQDAGFAGLAAGLLKEAAASPRFHIAVETPQAVCAERLAARVSKHSRLQESGTAADAGLWQNAERLRQTILHDLRAAYRLQGIPNQIITVDGTTDPVEAARRIAATILQIKLAQVLPRSTPTQGMSA